MQKKFGTVLNDKLFSEVKTLSHRENTTISHLLEKALLEYLQKKRNFPLGFSTIEASFGILKISPKTLKSILEQDLYETN